MAENGRQDSVAFHPARIDRSGLQALPPMSKSERPRGRSRWDTIASMSKNNNGEEAPADAQPAGAERASFRSALRGLRRAASEVAGASADEARKLAEAAKPEVERRARQAKAAADAVRPVIEERAREAADYVREHQDESGSASKRGASVAASGAARAVTPRPLRPAIDAMERELRGSSNEPSEGPDADTEAPDVDEARSPDEGPDNLETDERPGDAPEATDRP